MDPEAAVSSCVCSVKPLQVITCEPAAATFEGIEAMLDTLQRECSNLPGPWETEHRSDEQHQQQQQRQKQKKQQRQRQRLQQKQQEQQQQEKISCDNPLPRHQHTTSVKNKPLCDVTNIVPLGSRSGTQSTWTPPKKVRDSPLSHGLTNVESDLASAAAFDSLDLAAVELKKDTQPEPDLPDLDIVGDDVRPIFWVYNPLYNLSEEEGKNGQWCVRAARSYFYENTEEKEEKSEISSEDEPALDRFEWVYNPLYSSPQQAGHGRQ